MKNFKTIPPEYAQNNTKASFAKPELTTKDLTKTLYHISKELDFSNSLLQKTQQQKDSLFADISHDLRSPITAIRTSIDYLLSLTEPSKEEINSCLSLIKHKSIYLESLINDIFLLSSIGANNDLFHMEKINLTYILEEFFFALLQDNRYKEHNLSLEVSPELEAFVYIDSNMFVRVLDNLFSNALKYSCPKADIILGAFLEKNFVHIYIKDTGIGIDAEDLEKIFDIFYTSEASKTVSEDSQTGLGLSIVKAIILEFHGKVWCESIKSAGSTFHITLPLTSVT